jgi:hypothetical protein
MSDFKYLYENLECHLSPCMSRSYDPEYLVTEGAANLPALHYKVIKNAMEVIDMETFELQEHIFAFLEAAKGKRKLKEKDIIKGVAAEQTLPAEDVKKAMRAMIDAGRIMYSYTGGASSVEIPSEEYLKEKGLIK